MPHEFNRNNGPLFLTDRGLFSLVIRSLGYRGTEASGSREVHHMCVELWEIQLEVIKQLCVISAVLFESTRSFCLLFCLFVCPFQFILFVNHSMFDFFLVYYFLLFQFKCNLVGTPHCAEKDRWFRTTSRSWFRWPQRVLLILRLLNTLYFLKKIL